MTESALTKPVLLDSPFADDGDKTDIPATGSDGTVSQALGFPPAFSRPRATDGKSVSRSDMNGILYALSTFNHYFQYMGRNPWRSGVSYPNGACVFYEGSEYISQVDNNTSTPGEDEDSWTNNDPTQYQDSWLMLELADIKRRIAALEGGGGGGGSGYTDVEYLRFANNVVDRYAINFSDYLPTVRAWRDGSSLEGTYSIAKADTVSVVGLKFSMDPAFFTGDDERALSFFSWAPDQGTSNTYQKDSPSFSIKYYPKATTVSMRNANTVSVEAGGYLVTWSRATHSDGSTSFLRYAFGHSGNYLTSFPDKNTVFELAGGYGIHYYHLLGSSDDDSGIEGISVSSSAAITHKLDNTPSSESMASGGAAARAIVYIGRMMSRYYSSNSAYFKYMRIHEIFTGVVHKAEDTTATTTPTSFEGFEKQYRLLPMWSSSGTWAWKLVDASDNVLRNVCWASDEVGEQLFSHDPLS